MCPVPCTLLGVLLPSPPISTGSVSPVTPFDSSALRLLLFLAVTNVRVISGSPFYCSSLPAPIDFLCSVSAISSTWCLRLLHCHWLKQLRFLNTSSSQSQRPVGREFSFLQGPSKRPPFFIWFFVQMFGVFLTFHPRAVYFTLWTRARLQASGPPSLRP